LSCFKPWVSKVQSTFNVKKTQLLNFWNFSTIYTFSHLNGIFHNYAFWIINCFRLLLLNINGIIYLYVGHTKQSEFLWVCCSTIVIHFYLTFDHCPIYLVIMQVVSRCLVSNLCLELCIYNFELTFLHMRIQIQIWWCSTRVSWIWIPWHDANEEALFYFSWWNPSISK
jgi:hypothetical protein